MSIELLIAAAQVIEQESARTRNSKVGVSSDDTSSSPLSFDSTGSSVIATQQRRSATAESRASLTVDEGDYLCDIYGTHQGVRHRRFLREVHNRLEKNRRAHLRHCFELLRHQLPCLQRRRASDLSILRTALKCIAALKRKERACCREMKRLARTKTDWQQRLGLLRQNGGCAESNADCAANAAPATLSAPTPDRPSRNDQKDNSDATVSEIAAPISHQLATPTSVTANSESVVRIKSWSSVNDQSECAGDKTVAVRSGQGQVRSSRARSLSLSVPATAAGAAAAAVAIDTATSAPSVGRVTPTLRSSGVRSHSLTVIPSSSTLSSSSCLSRLSYRAAAAAAAATTTAAAGGGGAAAAAAATTAAAGGAAAGAVGDHVYCTQVGEETGDKIP